MNSGLHIEELPGGLLVASLALWNGEAWQAIPAPPQYGPGPVQQLTFLGFPIVFIEGRIGEGYQRKEFRDLFYGSFSEN